LFIFPVQHTIIRFALTTQCAISNAYIYILCLCEFGCSVLRTHNFWSVRKRFRSKLPI